MTAQPQPPTDTELSYEEALAQFDARLRALEDDRLGLEEAMAAVDEARLYLKICETKLETARHKIEVRPEPVAPPSDQAIPDAVDVVEEGRLL